ncbi:MAG: hypothetical protein OZSIB_3634 [Candidatus Ozemobacter sibiricus]|uniref:Uncharacterized protein n=1 Tax=Candidatus Ozemobacter sibiricus TaxID=2268124 RepID=A0A367ZQ16_9BACT|nr:MAG: hypothetical protein OZSIB_3634 [Candidatus Ozemobacter sibiricus]
MTMEQTPKLCPRCQQANFPIAEFCRHCGEPIFDMGALSRRSILSRFLGHLVDGLFWMIDELARWWEIGRLTLDLKALRKRRAAFLKQVGEGRPEGADLAPADREKLMSMSEEIARLASREEFLRKRSWALTPELLLLLIVCAFIAGLIWVRPRTDLAIPPRDLPFTLAGELNRFADLPLHGFSVVTSAVWHGNQIYVGGDGGLAVVDPNTRTATGVAGLPPGFFVRHLFSEGSRLLIAGYGGVYALEAQLLTPLYVGANLPVDLINRIIPTRDGGHLLGTIGHGLLKGRDQLAVMLLGTQGLTLTGFAWLDDELWLLHERGLLRGDGSSFTPFTLQVLTGRSLTALAAEPNTIYLGSTDGLVIGYRSDRTWVWTPLSPGEPRLIRDLVAARGVLLIAAAEGLFRYQEGRFQKLAALPDLSALAIGPGLVAAVSPTAVSLFQLTGSAIPPVAPLAPAVPTVGTFVAPPPPVAVQPPPVTPPGVSPPFLTSGAGPSAGPAPMAAPAPAPVAVAPPPPLPPLSAPVAPVSPPGPAPVAAPPAPGYAALPPPSSVQPVAPVTPPVAAPHPFFGSAPLPPALRGPFVSALAWDGRRLWVGTANEGLWVFQDGQWSALNSRNGGLIDDQIVSLPLLQGRPHLYSWVMGLMSLETGRAVPVLAKEHLRDHLAMAADASSIMFLFQGGFIRRLKEDGTLEAVSRIPEDFFKSARFLHLIDGQPVVVTDQGVLIRDGSGRWLVSFFPAEGRSLRVVASAPSPDGQVYAILSSGEVFSARGRVVNRVGAIDQKPRGMVFADTLWVAGTSQIYRLVNGALTPVGAKTGETVVGFQPVPERRIVFLATNAGVDVLPYP